MEERLKLVLTKHEKFCLVHIVTEVQKVFDILYTDQSLRSEPIDYHIVMGVPYSIKKLNYDLETYYYDSETPLNHSINIETSDGILVGYPIMIYDKFVDIINNRCEVYPAKLCKLPKGDYKRRIFEQYPLYSLYNIPKAMASELLDVIKYLESTKSTELTLVLLRGLLNKKNYVYKMEDAIHTVNKLKSRGYGIKVTSRSGLYYDYRGSTPITNINKGEEVQDDIRGNG